MVQEIRYKKVGKGLTCNGVLAVFSKGFNPLHPNISVHILRTVHYTFLGRLGIKKENLFNNQELLQLVIISFIPATLMSDSGGDTVRRNSTLVKN